MYTKALKAKIIHAHSFSGYKQGIYDQLALRELDCVRMLAKAAAAHTTVFKFPVSINLIGQFGTYEARPSWMQKMSVKISKWSVGPTDHLDTLTDIFRIDAKMCGQNDPPFSLESTQSEISGGLSNFSNTGGKLSWHNYHR